MGVDVQEGVFVVVILSDSRWCDLCGNAELELEVGGGTKEKRRSFSGVYTEQTWDCLNIV